MPRSQRRLDRILQVLACKQPDLTVVMENIHDPHNVSAILRSCDGVGVLRVELLYSVEAFPKIGKKSSSSANKWIETRKHRTVEACYAQLRREGFRICATTTEPDSVPLFDVNLARPTAFVVGNEHRGVSPEAANLADVRVRIPMVGMIESLNVSVAAAVCLYESFRQRLAGNLYAAPRLDGATLSVLAERWSRR